MWLLWGGCCISRAAQVGEDILGSSESPWAPQTSHLSSSSEAMGDKGAPKALPGARDWSHSPSLGPVTPQIHAFAPFFIHSFIHAFYLCGWGAGTACWHCPEPGIQCPYLMGEAQSPDPVPVDGEHGW